jgi:hypothetical protein
MKISAFKVFFLSKVLKIGRLLVNIEMRRSMAFYKPSLLNLQSTVNRKSRDFSKINILKRIKKKKKNFFYALIKIYIYLFNVYIIIII